MFWWQHLMAIWLLANMMVIALLVTNPRPVVFTREKTGNAKRRFKESFDAVSGLDGHVS